MVFFWIRGRGGLGSIYIIIDIIISNTHICVKYYRFVLRTLYTKQPSPAQSPQLILWYPDGYILTKKKQPSPPPL